MQQMMMLYKTKCTRPHKMETFCSAPPMTGKHGPILGRVIKEKKKSL
jgi:hypothetical protein